jgi:Mg-chelatase subunit ChlD
MKMKKLIATMLLLVLLPTVFATKPSLGGSSNEVPESVPETPTEEPYKPRIDVVFLIDSTGSMADEIRTVKTHISKIVKEVERGYPKPYLRVGLVTYRDHKQEEREYLYKKKLLTRNVDEFLRNIAKIEAYGGGDHPEAVVDGLHVAINDMNWDMQALRLIFLIGDAAPHGVGSSDRSYEQGCPKGYDHIDEINIARKKGIKIFTVSGSGIDGIGIKVWKKIAEKTGGIYTSLNYIRRDVDQYYKEESIDEKWAVEAKKDVDYDRETNSILTNNLGIFAKASVMKEATDIGVRYGDEVIDNNDEAEYEETSIEEEIDYIKELYTREGDNGLYSFFQNIFNKIIFWR